MKTLIAVLALCTLSGCAVGVKTLAWVYNSSDPCQARNNGGQYPSFCGKGDASVITVNNRVYRLQGTKSVPVR
jgi:hypothetical protein